MRLIQLVEYVKSVTARPVYPLQFPYNSSEDNILVVDIINGVFTGSLTEMNIQIMTRSKHPSTAEEMANTLISTFHNKNNELWDGWQIVLMQAKNPNPFFNGQSDNDFYIYTTDFRILVTK